MVLATAEERACEVGKGKAVMVRVERFTSSSPLREMGTLARALKTDSGRWPMGVVVLFSSQIRVYNVESSAA